MSKTLLVDSDPQANATSGIGVDPYSIEKGTYEVLTQGADIKDAIFSTSSPNLDLLPSSLDLIGAEIDLVKLRKGDEIINCS